MERISLDCGSAVESITTKTGLTKQSEIHLEFFEHTQGHLAEHSDITKLSTSQNFRSAHREERKSRKIHFSCSVFVRSSLSSFCKSSANYSKSILLLLLSLSAWLELKEVWRKSIRRPKNFPRRFLKSKGRHSWFGFRINFHFSLSGWMIKS